MKKHMTIGILLGSCCLMVFAGCGPSDQRESPAPTANADSSAKAVLDFDRSMITLPLDAYDMTEQEAQIAAAARQIVFAQCITGSQDVSDVTRNAARETLAFRDQNSELFYGFWDAPYVAVHGMGISSTGIPLGEGLDVDVYKAKECVQEQPYLDLMPIFQEGVMGNGNPSDKMVSAYIDSFDETTADPRFIALIDARSSCIKEQGFSIEDKGSYDGVALLDTYSEEEKLKAMLAEAQCSDDENLVQQAGDITAEYQQQYIDANQAELTALKELANERVAKATKILQDAGVM